MSAVALANLVSLPRWSTREMPRWAAVSAGISSRAGPSHLGLCHGRTSAKAPRQNVGASGGSMTRKTDFYTDTGPGSRRRGLEQSLASLVASWPSTNQRHQAAAEWALGAGCKTSRSWRHRRSTPWSMLWFAGTGRNDSSEAHRGDATCRRGPQGARAFCPMSGPCPCWRWLSGEGAGQSGSSMRPSRLSLAITCIPRDGGEQGVRPPHHSEGLPGLSRGPEGGNTIEEPSRRVMGDRLRAQFSELAAVLSHASWAVPVLLGRWAGQYPATEVLGTAPR